MATYTLTTGVDSVAGTAGDDTVYATAATLNAGDSLTGGAGTDVLVLVGSGTYRVDQLASFTGFEDIRLNNATAYYDFLTLGSQPIEVDATGNWFIQANSPSNWNGSNIINGDASHTWNSTVLSFYNNQGVYPPLPVTYDLTSNTLSHVNINGVGDNVTLLINSADTAGIQSITGFGQNAKLATAGSTLDLSHTTVSGLSVTSTNALGTAFTVKDLGTALQIAGGPGHDTLIAQGLTLTANQRAEIFGTGSIETITDQSGTYNAPSLPPPSPPTTPRPVGTTADMILRHGADGQYYIYDIGNNSVLAAYSLGQVGTEWTVAGLGGFFGNDTTDMILRDGNNGAFEVYDISNNNVTNAASMGTVGLEWTVAGFGGFSNHAGETDMMLRDVNTGGFEVYDISNNQITNAAFMGAVGAEWKVAGFGNFSSLGEADMILRNMNTGGFEVYDISNNMITNAAFMGTVGLEWQASGFGNFSSNPGETDMLLRNSNTGGLEVYDISNNQITGAAFLGAVGLEWQFVGVAPVHSPGASDLVLRNVNTGAFEVYDIANNQITGAAPLGAVGTDWQVGGIAADPPTGSIGSSSQTAQLVQAMASFGGGDAAESLNTAALGADTSQQPFLTTPQHA
jgi:hypothetical protein